MVGMGGTKTLALSLDFAWILMIGVNDAFSTQLVPSSQAGWISNLLAGPSLKLCSQYSDFRIFYRRGESLPQINTETTVHLAHTPNTTVTNQEGVSDEFPVLRLDSSPTMAD